MSHSSATSGPMFRILIATLAVIVQSGSAAPLPDFEARIIAVAATSSCAKYYWQDRGHAPIGYIKGVALVYSKAYCDVKSDRNSAAMLVAGNIVNRNSDALELYDKAEGTPFKRLRVTYALAIGEGMRESGGNTTEGYDTTVHNQTAETAEAGLFQVSHDSIDGSAELQKLYERYKRNSHDCRLKIFMEGVKSEQVPPIGTGAGAEFQEFTKSCPAFATEYATEMLRTNRNHFGPIKRKEAELIPACEDMLRSVESVADEHCRSL